VPRRVLVRVLLVPQRYLSYAPGEVSETPVKWMALPVLCGTACVADEARRPPCNAPNRGRLWPEQANSDREFARRAERCGELLMCTPGVWKSRWEQLTVHVSRLGNAPKRDIPPI
jgi:hypothetical protein